MSSPRHSRADASRRTSSSDASAGGGGTAVAADSASTLPGETGEFIRECRAAYLCFVDSLDEDLQDKQQMTLVLQHAGRNPSNKTIEGYDITLPNGKECS